MDATLVAWGAIAALGWLLRMAWIARVGLALRWLRDLDPPEPARWPSLSVVLAARDERATIEATVEALLAQSYPGLKVVVVDDRSADGTGEILDRLAAGDPRLCVVHVRELPAGWLGKVHALERGRAAARGE
ncbi:MAG: glycosyltransferase [Acidobacteria bacterium]|nr:glycosyltransferase [Acidobacteriota bacterium]